MSIMVIATLELQSPDLLEDWKKISDAITDDLKANKVERMHKKVLPLV